MSSKTGMPRRHQASLKPALSSGRWQCNGRLRMHPSARLCLQYWHPSPVLAGLGDLHERVRLACGVAHEEHGGHAPWAGREVLILAQAPERTAKRPPLGASHPPRPHQTCPCCPASTPPGSCGPAGGAGAWPRAEAVRTVSHVELTGHELAGPRQARTCRNACRPSNATRRRAPGASCHCKLPKQAGQGAHHRVGVGQFLCRQQRHAAGQGSAIGIG